MTYNIDNTFAQNMADFSPKQSVTEGLQVPFTEDDDPRSIYSDIEAIQSAPISNWEVLKESAKLMYQDTTIEALKRLKGSSEARKTTDIFGRPIDNPTLSAEEANNQYAQYGVSFDKAISKNEAEVIAARKIKENTQKSLLQKSQGTFLSGVSSLTGSLVGGMLDPINLATAFIPVTKLVPALKSLEAAGFWGRTAVRGIDGVVMNSLVEPLPLWAASVDQRDYTLTDSLMGLAAGGIFNAGIGAFADGVRLLSKGEKFNTGVASAIDFANDRSLENLQEFQRGKLKSTSFTYDELVELPDSKLRVTTEGRNTLVSLADDGPLAEIVGVGLDLDTAKADLGKQVGLLLDNPGIADRYRFDDGLENLYTKLSSSEYFDDLDWFDTWLGNIQGKALDQGLSPEEYIAKATKNFTEFDEFLARVKQSKDAITTAKAKQAKEILSLKSDEILDLDASYIDTVADVFANRIAAYSKLKEMFRLNPKQHLDFDTYIGDLRQNITTKQDIVNNIAILKSQLAKLQADKVNLSKELYKKGKLQTKEDLVATIKSKEKTVRLLKAKIAKIEVSHGKYITKETKAAKVASITKELNKHLEDIDLAKKQLDNPLVTITEQKLKAEIDKTTASINDLNNKINLSDSDIEIKNLEISSDTNRVATLERIREQLEVEPRDFSDVEKTLTKQTEDNKSWETSDPLVNGKVVVNEAKRTEMTNVDEILTDIELTTKAIDTAIKGGKFSADELKALDIAEDGRSIEMVRADNKVAAMDALEKDLDNYAACKQTEAG